MLEKKVLGRGISSLIRSKPQPTSTPDLDVKTPPAIASAGEIKELAGFALELPIEKITVNPQNPRRHFDEAALDELCASIKATGLIQPILVRVIDGNYEIIAGERRFRASKLAGLTKIPAIIRQSDDLDQLEVALIENLQRQDLTAIEEAQGYERLSTYFSLTQDQIAQKVGKERSTVANLLRLLKLPPMVQKMVNMNELTMGHARALLSLETAKQQEETASFIADKSLSVRQAEKLIAQVLARKQLAKVEKKEAHSDVNLKHYTEQMQRRLGTKVEIKPKGKGGEIVVKYFTAEDLTRLLHVLK